MLTFSCIGNLGSDARVEQSAGGKFVSFSIGVNDNWTDADGVRHESTKWISCAMNGDGGAVLPYLKKGKSVFVEGRGDARVYSSPKERRMVAGLNINVQRLELLGGASDDVPKRLFSSDGVEFHVKKAYFVAEGDAKQLGVTEYTQAELISIDGRMFQVKFPGWVEPKTIVNEHTDGENQTGANQGQ